MIRYLIPTLFFVAIPLATARPWKNSDGSKTIEAEFVKRDASTVTLRLESGKETTLELAKLHADERKWLNLNHPIGGESMPDQAAVFDTLKLGDSYDTVLAKLKASKFVEMTLADNLLGRTGLNGVFRLKQKVGGLDSSLYFDWTGDDKLQEVTLRTDPLPAASYAKQVAPSWTEFIGLLTTLHGKPLQAAPRVDPSAVPEGSMVASHLWRMESGGSALLGVGCEGGKYQVIVRFTGEKIAPVTTRPAAPAGPGAGFEF